MTAYSGGRVVVMAALMAGSAAACIEPVPSAAVAPEPRLGQPGKDIPWVPSPEPLVDRMLDLARLNSSDYLIDLGSGDGRLVIAAARRGVRARGIEFEPGLVAFATDSARRAGVDWRATFVQGDIFQSDLSQATVITLFLSSEINLRLRPRLLELEPGTRIISNTFTMADWNPDETAKEGDCETRCDAMLWIVPAQVAGEWRLGQETLRLEQAFQRVTGTLDAADLTDVRLRGHDISFTAASRRYTGRVGTTVMSGTTDTGGTWSADRTP